MGPNIIFVIIRTKKIKPHTKLLFWTIVMNKVRVNVKLFHALSYNPNMTSLTYNMCDPDLVDI